MADRGYYKRRYAPSRPSVAPSLSIENLDLRQKVRELEEQLRDVKSKMTLALRHALSGCEETGCSTCALIERTLDEGGKDDARP